MPGLDMGGNGVPGQGKAQGSWQKRIASFLFPPFPPPLTLLFLYRLSHYVYRIVRLTSIVYVWADSGQLPLSHLDCLYGVF
jgi:hypothetical protein